MTSGLLLSRPLATTAHNRNVIDGSVGGSYQDGTNSDTPNAINDPNMQRHSPSIRGNLVTRRRAENRRTPPPRLDLPIRASWLRTRWYTCETFEEALLTLLPSSALSLVNVMAACNLGSIFFHLYATCWWLLKNNISCCADGRVFQLIFTTIVFGPGETMSVSAHIIWVWLMAEITVGIWKLLFRFNTKRRCMIHLRSPERVEEQEELYKFLHSLSFRLHIGFGRTQQILNFIGHMLYFLLAIDNTQLQEKVSLLRLSFMRRTGAIEEEMDDNDIWSGAVLLDVCCTNAVIGCFRVLFSLYVLHYYAYHDQRQRRRAMKAKTGLTKAEINNVLKEVQFSKTACNSDPTCSICLETFHEGETVAVSPCDGKHSFHFSCIKTWLSKRATCPLCQHRLS